ncbi:hypothetical protein ACFO26_02865 [Lactococcus nasutitermitis]|uniref:Uncharacterized protein n=1 Tax=Lactococcus nasutitermitis TaxID=1652957 RepID=A0ABV9JBH1_9LACT|nr:hypothetical protein [Lactococcus nasutitermitis]
MADFFKDIKNLLSDLLENVDNIKVNAERVQTELKKTERTSQDITRKVSEFQNSTQPKIDKINEILEKFNSANENQEE